MTGSLHCLSDHTWWHPASRSFNYTPAV